MLLRCVKFRHVKAHFFWVIWLFFIELKLHYEENYKTEFDDTSSCQDLKALATIHCQPNLT